MAIRRGSGYSFRSGSYSSLRSRKFKNDLAKRHEVGVEAYGRFEKQVWQLNEKLRELCNEARTLGGSAAILSTATRLRERLSRILHLFRQTAQTLYPEEMKARSHSLPTKPKRHRKLRSRVRDKIRQYFPAESAGADNMAMEFRAFSKDIKTLFKCFNQIPEFKQELPDQAVSKDLKHWVETLDNFEHDFDTLAAQTYLYDCMMDIGDLLEILAEGFIPVFTKFGIPAIRASQEHDSSNLQNQTVVATLFAGVATGMIQVYGSIADGALKNAIILLWYMTLLFSIGSTVNGLLGLSWTQAVYRSPNDRVPRWIPIWIRRFPLVFLVLAIDCSFVAIMLFAFLPQQNLATQIITTCLSISSCCGLAAVSSWFGGELLIFCQYHGRKWLADVIDDIAKGIKAFIHKIWSQAMMHVRKLVVRTRSPADIEQQDVSAIDSFWIGEYKDSDAMSTSARARYRWHEAVSRVIQNRRQPVGRDVTTTSPRFAHLIRNAALRFDSVSKLQSMTVSYSVDPALELPGPVRALQFSPNGHFLVSSGVCHEPVVRCIGRYPEYEQPLAHPLCARVDHVRQTEWSRDSRRLLLRSRQNLVAWELNIPDDTNRGDVPQPRKLFEHKPDAHDKAILGACWNGDGTRCYSMQGRRVLTMDALGKILQDYSTQHLELRDVCVTSDSSWMICVGKYVQEHRQIGQYGIIVWDLRIRKVAKHIPVYYPISKVTLASDNSSVLVSYENNKSPSQCWRLVVTEAASIDFTLRHSYIARDCISFAAIPSIFGGENDHLVLRATPVGDIHVWDRDSANPLHCIRALPTSNVFLTSLAWNRGSRSYIFATGMSDGTVHIWREGRPETDAKPNCDSPPAITSQ